MHYGSTYNFTILHLFELSETTQSFYSAQPKSHRIVLANRPWRTQNWLQTLILVAWICRRGIL